MENEGIWNSNNLTENIIRNLIPVNVGGKKMRLQQFLRKLCLKLQGTERELDQIEGQGVCHRLYSRRRVE
jgi:hypothetical protein